MENTANKNMEKYYTYREQFERLDLAIEKEFYLEAVFIAYAIMEDRTESTMRHLGIWESNLGNKRYLGISDKLKAIRKNAVTPDSPSCSYMKDATLDKCVTWINRRNDAIHDLIDNPLSHAQMRALALEGKRLARRITDCTGATKRALKKLQTAAEEK